MISLVIITLAFFLLVEISVSKTSNRTIDDQNGDSFTHSIPVYSPTLPWSQGRNCMTCHINGSLVDANRTVAATWHDATYIPSQPELSIAFNFTGTAIYVYNILVNQDPGTITFTNMTFHLNGSLVGQFMHTPERVIEVLYGVLVYANNSLENETHLMEIRAGGTDISLILFDYAEYTFEYDENERPDPSHMSSLSTSATPTLPLLPTLPQINWSTSSLSTSSSSSRGIR